MLKCLRTGGLRFVRDELVGYICWNGTVAGLKRGIKRDNHDGLKLFQNSYSLRMYHKFLGYISDKKLNELVGGPFLTLVRLDVWIVTVVYCCQYGTTRVHRQKIYGDTFGGNIEMAVDQIVGQIRVFAEAWEQEEQKVPIESKDEKP